MRRSAERLAQLQANGVLEDETSLACDRMNRNLWLRQNVVI